MIFASETKAYIYAASNPVRIGIYKFMYDATSRQIDGVWGLDGIDRSFV